MRLVTLNTWKNEGDYPRRLELMARGLAALSPDVVCLQECFVGAGRDTAAALAARTGLTLHAAPSRTKLRRHGARRVLSASGLAILARAAGRARVLTLPSDPTDGERIAQLLDLGVCDPPLRVLNLHLTHLRGPAAVALRGRQLAAALAWADEDLSGALMVAGDLNATARCAELAVLGLAPAPATLQPPRFTGEPQDGLAIDHCCLLRPGGWRLAGRRVALDRPDPQGWLPSDHVAVVVDLQRRGAP